MTRDFDSLVLNYQTPLEVFTSYMMATGRIVG